MAISMTRTLPDLSKMEPLDGTNFKRWSQKLLIFFEQLEVDYVLFTDPPKITTQTTDTSTAIITTSQTDSSRKEDELKAKYEKDNRTVRSHLLNYMTNTLFDLFVNHKSARTIWNTLESRNHLKHKKRDLTLQELISHMRTEEANRLKDKAISNSSFSIKANLVEPSESSKDRFQRKGQKFKKNVQQKSHKGNDGKIQKNKCQCYCCGKTGHKAYQCYQRKDQQKTNQKQNLQLNLAETEEIIAAVVVEANLVENKVDWILDTGASNISARTKSFFMNFMKHQMENASLWETQPPNGKRKAFLVDEDPKTYVEAITSIDSSFWKEAIKNELDSIITNHTWDRVDLPVGSKPIKCKWIFKKKIKPDGSIDKFKARLVVVGYTQNKGIDYFDTYSPVTKIATIRALIALSAINDLMIHQMDVKTAFLNGDLEEEIYMEQPEGFVVPGLESKFDMKDLGEADVILGVLEGFCDAKWVTDNDEVSSTSGYVFTLVGGAISWKSAKQTCIARSTIESEFIALELAGQEAEWLRNLIGDIPLWGSTAPVSLHCLASCYRIAKNYAYNGKRRHIRLRHSAVKELLKNGIISLDYVRSERNLADPLTKGLTRRIIQETSRAMGLKPLEL
ncbi:Retrovirus-related Pol polyprotein from transposon TNT 1-94 [Sesamum angolense]|uniref:Retrovirus-related Pol polyprotein from transposon TNT 1-94 n=1 Tax=Sesamum angolense TaxID=2727404 RepID=A0AAE2C292_9LAMI|nr:Retrovirus-related Pol polyprotein from transposon TNT 1-94 [Sesamum angolense]